MSLLHPYTPGMSKRPKRTPRPTESTPPAANRDEWRLFVAVPLPVEVTSLLGSLQQAPAIAGLPLRMVDPDIAHLTLSFLGDTAPERAELLSMSLPPTLSQQRSCTLRTANLGVFPNERKPRVLWLGLAGQTDGLLSIHRTLTASLRKLGFDVDDGPFQPHITIGRVRDGSFPNLPSDVKAAFGDAEIRRLLAEPVTFDVREVHLIRSHLEKSGPRYETLRVANLKS